jgi:hypothetical protein
MDAARQAAGGAADDGRGSDSGPPGFVLIRLGPLAPGAGPFLADQLTALLLDRPDTRIVVCDVSLLDRPTPVDLDHLGRLALAAGRQRCGLRLRGTPDRLRLLLVLTGLDERFEEEC